MFATNEYFYPRTRVTNIYSVPPQYNTLIAQKLPTTVPSQSFPTLLNQNQNAYGYNSLSHDNDMVGYYNMTSAYGETCEPSYMIAKCPENKQIRVFNPEEIVVSSSALPNTNQFISEGYADAPNKYNSPGQILFYTSKNCVHCATAREEYKKILGTKFDEVFDVRDVTSNTKNQQDLTNYGGTGVPFFVNPTTHNKVIGYLPFHELISKLNATQIKDIVKKIQDLNLIVYIANGCQHCVRLKKLLGQYSSFIEYRNKDDPRFASEVRIIKGFPFITSKTTNKSYLGVPPSLTELIQQLN
jgi:glutaredoxin